MATKTYYHNSRVVGSVSLSNGTVVTLKPLGYYSIPDGVVVGRMPNMVQMNPPSSQRGAVIDLGALAGYAQKAEEAVAAVAKELLAKAPKKEELVGGVQRPFNVAVSVTPVDANLEEKAKYRLGRKNRGDNQ